MKLSDDQVFVLSIVASVAAAIVCFCYGLYWLQLLKHGPLGFHLGGFFSWTKPRLLSLSKRDCVNETAQQNN